MDATHTGMDYSHITLAELRSPSFAKRRDAKGNSVRYMFPRSDLLLKEKGRAELRIKPTSGFCATVFSLSQL